MSLPPRFPAGAARRESVPFAFVAEADRFRSNVTPPPRQRAGGLELAGNVLIGLVIVAGFAGTLLFGLPALESGPQDPRQAQHSEASDNR
ncbi:hypothetical protein ACZ90_61865 [Streptomyces albus subsp. albus]|nr:hypothetical protein ACZ90_61865 [Streptomyces albus subsp. albus]